jgi:Fe-S cluster assembly iron-binding protein IscA
MVDITERAREMFKARLDHMTDRLIDRSDVALRIGATSSGLGVFPDTRTDDDEVIEHKGKTVLLIDHEVSTALAGKTIDVDEHPDGPRFVVRR